MTLLNDMGHSFVGKDYRKVKLSGVNLSGADLTKTNLQRSCLDRADLSDCKLIQPRLEGANLARAKFGRKPAFKGHGDKVAAVCFSPDDTLIASGSHDHTVRVWETATGQTVRILQGHESLVTAVVFSPDGTLIASGSWDWTVVVISKKI